MLHERDHFTWIWNYEFASQKNFLSDNYLDIWCWKGLNQVSLFFCFNVKQLTNSNGYYFKLSKLLVKCRLWRMRRGGMFDLISISLSITLNIEYNNIYCRDYLLVLAYPQIKFFSICNLKYLVGKISLV